MYAETGNNFILSEIPNCKRIYNIFHPSDLIAYRIEPLIKSHADMPDPCPEDVKPAILVPCYQNSGLNST